MNVIEAIRGRSSIRAYLDREVPQALLDAVLEAARFAPSGVNSQPWRVAVVRGRSKASVTAALVAAREAGVPENPDYRYYPAEWFEPYKGRRRGCGLALYDALRIGRDDETGRKEAWNNNYRFFGAPVGLFFFLDRRLGQGSWVDMGMFIQNVMLAARGLGLGTCPQAALADYPEEVRGLLGVEDRFALVCGMSLGWPDPQAPVNQFRLEREPVVAFTSFHD